MPFLAIVLLYCKGGVPWDQGSSLFTMTCKPFFVDIETPWDHVIRLHITPRGYDTNLTREGVGQGFLIPVMWCPSHVMCSRSHMVDHLINPIDKSGEMRCPENYRKITLLSSLGTLFDSILNNRLFVSVKKPYDSITPMAKRFQIGIADHWQFV